MSRKILIQLYSQKDSSSLIVCRSKSADHERESNITPLTYINPRIIQYIYQHEEDMDGKQDQARSIALKVYSPEQSNNDHQNREKSISDNIPHSPLQQKPTKEKKLKFKDQNFNPNNGNNNANSNFNISGESFQDIQSQQFQQQQLLIASQPKQSSKSYQSQQSSESVASNLNTTTKSTSFNLDESIYADHKKDENDSKRLQEEYQKNQFFIFENEIKTNLIRFCTHRYYRFVLEKVLESGNYGHKEWIIFQLYKNFDKICYDQYGSKIFIICLSVAKLEFEDYYKNYVDLIFKESNEVEQIYFSRYGQKIIREYLSILEGYDLEQLLKRINIKLFNPLEQSSKFNNLVNSEILGDFLSQKKYLCSEQYGCLIINFIVDLFSQNQFHHHSQQVEQIIIRIVKRAFQLSQHYYSNYTIQHILEKLPNNCEINLQLQKVLLPNLTYLSKNKFGSNVIEKAISNGDDAFREEIWKVLSNQSSQGEYKNFELLVNDQYANYVIQRFYENCNSMPIKQQFEEILINLSQSNRLQQYGQHVRMQIFEKHKPEIKIHHFSQKDPNSNENGRLNSSYSQKSYGSNQNSHNNNMHQKRYNYSRNGSSISNESESTGSISRKSSSNITTSGLNSINKNSNTFSALQYQSSGQNQNSNLNNSNFNSNPYMQNNYNNINPYTNKSSPLAQTNPKNQMQPQYNNQHNGIYPFNYSQNVNQKMHQHLNQHQTDQLQQYQQPHFTPQQLFDDHDQSQNQNSYSNQQPLNYGYGQKNLKKLKLEAQGNHPKGVGQKQGVYGQQEKFNNQNSQANLNYGNYQNSTNISGQPFQQREQKLIDNNRRIPYQNQNTAAIQSQTEMKTFNNEQINCIDNQQKLRQQQLQQPEFNQNLNYQSEQNE